MSKNYNWSDDDEIEIEPQPDRMFPPSETESDEEYENYNKIINEKLCNDDIDNRYNIKQEKIVKNKNCKEIKQKTKINLWETINKKPEEKKTWSSKRMQQKRINEGKIKVKNRQFNPRLPIPIKNNKKILNNNNKFSIKFDKNNFPEINL